MVGPNLFLIYLYDIFNICVLAMAKAQACRHPSDLINLGRFNQATKNQPLQAQGLDLTEPGDELRGRPSETCVAEKKTEGICFMSDLDPSRTSTFFSKESVHVM